MSELKFPRVNSIVLSGRLTREPELKYIPSGTPVAYLPVAFDRAYQKNGEWVQDVSYVTVVVWSKRGEQCAAALHKGSPILVEGYLNVRTYIDKENITKKIVEVVSNKINFLEKDDLASYSPSGGRGSEPYDSTTGEVYEESHASVQDDDVPFNQ